MKSNFLSAMLLFVLLFFFFGCGRSEKNAIRVEGSDTMINVAQAWAEIYHENHHSVSIQISGGGSGVGIASLIDGNCDLADTSRKMKEKELKLARENHHGAEPVEHIVGYDSLAIYVHKDNPIESISLPELAEIYGDGGTITKWSQLGVKMPAGSDTIIRVSRQNSSGTYAYFHDAVLGKKRNYKLGSIDQSGSKDVVTLVSTTPGAIGYSGMGYQTDEVKMVKVSRKPHEPGIAPSVENAQNKTYPITRPLQIYTIGELQPAVQDYLDWIVSAEGQKVVLELGYVPLFP